MVASQAGRGSQNGGSWRDPKVGARLQALLAATEFAVAPAAAANPVDNVLAHVAEALEADTATVLLLDESGEYLVAHATYGLSEEIYQGVRIRLGARFSGAIAAERTALAIDRVDRDTVDNPILWDKGLRTMLGAPLLRDGELIGVLHVGRFAPRAFSNDETRLILVAADRVASATTLHGLAEEAAAARILERSLLPTRFPTVAGAEFAGRYVAAADRMVGGDWYDAFTLPTGELWLVVGDVVGHGLRSAVVMGRIRSALRAYALIGGGPARALEQTDHKVHHFEMGRMTTVLCAVAAPPYETFTISSAGHVPPVLGLPGGEARLVEVDTNLPLGADRDATRTTVTVDVPLGGMLLLYTDGLVERGGAAIDEGLERLRRIVTVNHPEAVCRDVMLRMIGDSIPGDDVAVLAMRRVAIPGAA